MATVPMSTTTPSTVCTICCQVSLTSFDSRGSSGSDMIVDTARSFQRLRPGMVRPAPKARGVVIFPCPARVFYGTEDNVQGASGAHEECQFGARNHSWGFFQGFFPGAFSRLWLRDSQA